jgi:acyl carrier protein
MTPNEILDLLLDFIATTFVVGKEEINCDTSLVQSGVIDSIGLIEIAEFIESRFALSVSETDLSRNNFGSVNKMVAYINGRLQS